MMMMMTMMTMMMMMMMMMMTMMMMMMMMIGDYHRHDSEVLLALDEQLKATEATNKSNFYLYPLSRFMDLNG